MSHQPGRIPHSRPSLGAIEADAVADVVRSGQVATGPQVSAFENGMARFLNLAGGVAVSSGTAALELALRAVGVQIDDEVLMPSYVCAAPWLAARRVGATVKLVDIDPVSYAIDPLQTARLLSRRTRAIIVPHLFGLPADLTALQSLGVPLIEDCAQTLGATEAGRAVGTVGAATICSFYATKLLCAGEGGMVLSHDPKVLERVRALRDYDGRSQLDVSAFNFKMTDLQAAIGLRQLARLPSFIERRRTIAARYDQALRAQEVDVPEPPKGRTHVYYRYVVRLEAPRVQTRLEDALVVLNRYGICCRRPVFQALHQYLGVGSFPRTEHAMATALSAPLYPSLTDEEVGRVIEALCAVVKSGSAKR